MLFSLNLTTNFFTAIRFEALVPAKVDNPKHEDTLEKVDRERVEKMVADNKGITTMRKI